MVTLRSGEDREQFLELLGEVKPQLWPYQVSAELTTMAASDPKGKSCSLPSGQTAVLIASDTSKGLHAALFNAVAIAAGDLERVRYLPEPTPDIVKERGNVVIVRMPGLDAGNNKVFLEAMRGFGLLGQGIDRLLKNDEDMAARFHLSGGFKAALPYLLGLGEALHSLRGKSSVQAYTVHELSRDLSSIELPLRSLPSGLLSQQLAGTDAEGRFALSEVAPGQYTLEVQSVGYARVTQPVTVQAGQVAQVTVQLVPAAAAGATYHATVGPVPGKFFCGFGTLVVAGPCMAVGFPEGSPLAPVQDVYDDASGGERNLFEYPTLLHEEAISPDDGFKSIVVEVAWVRTSAAAGGWNAEAPRPPRTRTNPSATGVVANPSSGSSVTVASGPPIRRALGRQRSARWPNPSWATELAIRKHICSVPAVKSVICRRGIRSGSSGA